MIITFTYEGSLKKDLKNFINEISDTRFRIGLVVKTVLIGLAVILTISFLPLLWKMTILKIL